jgi:hypothetical protein
MKHTLHITVRYQNVRYYNYCSGAITLTLLATLSESNYHEARVTDLGFLANLCAKYPSYLWSIKEFSRSVLTIRSSRTVPFNGQRINLCLKIDNNRYKIN